MLYQYWLVGFFFKRLKFIFFNEKSARKVLEKKNDGLASLKADRKRR